MPHLFASLKLRHLLLRNRIMMSPMCMYCAQEDGLATDWHLSHYTARALGGVGLILTEATAVESRGRISPYDLGLWCDEQIAPLARIVEQVQRTGGAIGVQLAHAGRKAWSRARGHGPEEPVAPSPLPHSEAWRTPHPLTLQEIEQTVGAWQAAAVRAEAAGFDVVEIHGAHGYLNHEFLSPISNHRSDEYGGDLGGRMRFLLRVVEAVREVWPEEKPLLVRLSATDWVEDGLSVNDTVKIARALRESGVDLADCSTGGISTTGPRDPGPGFQIPFAEAVRSGAGVATAAVGLITTPELADATVRNGHADLVALGRELLRHPHWPLDAARTLGKEGPWPEQYRRARQG